jgi:tRNA pseudouridine13 synthase
MPRFLPSPETFVVEEIPAYLPAGEGEHAYLWIEKRDLTTLEAVNRLARALDTDARNVGYAGMKDRRATTRQWLSVLGADAARVAQVEVAGLRVLAVSRHKNKLRVGHLRGNWFEVVLDRLAPGDAEAMAAALATLAQTGVPNRFGHQRFGATGDNLAAGLALLRGTRREPDGRRRKLLLSAVQSAVFNRVLELRAAEGGLLAVRTGDILERAVSGGQFVCADVAHEQARVDSGEVVPTGPLPGSHVRAPEPGTAARALEDRALADLGIAPGELEHVGRTLPGTRRALVVKITLGEPPLTAEQDRLRLRFSLPAGGYATVVLDALGVSQERSDQPVLASDAEPTG